MAGLRLLGMGLGAAAAMVTALGSPSSAHACGGFFCNNLTPVNQAAERIIFSQAPDGSVTAVIQIQYAGPSEEFAWMLPVAGSPEIQVSSNAAFTALQQATNPQYILNTRVEGMCDDGFFRGAPSSADGTGGFADAGLAPSGPEVTIVDQGSVGPYNFVVINVDEAASDKAEVAIEWLQENEYDVPDAGGDLLRPYLEGGMNLLAFRLSKGNDTGSIRPVVLSFGTGLPSIPIRPTAVAANDDMGVMVWVLGESRAVPANYRSLELNEALINWLNPNSTYNDVVIRAANEAGGQGFVTEMAGDARPLADTIFSEFQAENWANILTTDWTGQESDLLNTSSSFGGLDGYLEAILAHVPPPQGVSRDEFEACPQCYFRLGEADIDGFEPAAFIETLRTDVIEPMVRTRELFEARPYVTRFYTTMSAEEMTMDPVFDFNADLSDVSSTHNADRIIECGPGRTQNESPWRVELDDGSVIRGVGNNWPFDVQGTVPANRRVLRLGNTGQGEVVTDNTAAIVSAVRTSNASMPLAPAGVAGGGACSVGGSAGGFAGLAFALLGLVGVARRRRR